MQNQVVEPIRFDENVGKGRIEDFDAATADDEEQIRFKIGGEIYALPADPPAEHALKLYRQHIAGELSDPSDAIRFFLGADTADRLLGSGIGIKKLNRLIDWILEKYNIKPTEEEMAAARKMFGEGKQARNPTPAASI